MPPFPPIVHRLEGKARPEVAAIPLVDPEQASHVVDHLVAGAEEPVVDGGAEVLEVDPAGHDNRGAEQQFQGRLGLVKIV